jgi:hypothetical protein
VHHHRSRTSPKLAPPPAAALLLLPGLSSFPPAELLLSASLARACSPTPMAVRCVQYSGVGKPMGRRVRAVVRRRKSGAVDLGRRGSGEEEFCRSIVADTERDSEWQFAVIFSNQMSKAENGSLVAPGSRGKHLRRCFPCYACFAPWLRRSLQPTHSLWFI